MSLRKNEEHPQPSKHGHYRGTPESWRFSSKCRAEPSPARRISILLFLSALAIGACGQRPKPAPKQLVVGWRPVASWSGRGNTQTESFNMESGQWRIRWETIAERHSTEGTFRIIVHSSVSGRFVEVAVEHEGAGNGLVYMAEDPRQFFLDIESSGVDWKVTVEEEGLGEQRAQPSS
jgi:hypothetical protein